MTDLSDLIARLEAAMEGSREFDAQIWWACERQEAEKWYHAAAPGKPKQLDDNPPGGLGWMNVVQHAPRYTTSLDAALTLIPEGCAWELRYTLTGEASATVYGHDIHADVDAATPTLALCITALRARRP